MNTEVSNCGAPGLCTLRTHTHHYEQANNELIQILCTSSLFPRLFQLFYSETASIPVGNTNTCNVILDRTQLAVTDQGN